MTASGWPWAETAAVYAVGSIVTAWLTVQLVRRERKLLVKAQGRPAWAQFMVAAISLLWPIFWAGILASLVVYPPRDGDGVR